MHTNIENNAILRGMKTDPQRAGILEEITEYVEQQGLTGQEVILYGWIPSLSYYLEMPCAITSWPDLPSYNGDVMQTDLEQIAEGIERRERRAPVLILNKEQGVYLQGGTEALESLGLSSEAAENYGADRKLQMLKDFADRYHYALTFENEKLMLFQAQQEAEAAR